MGVWVEIWKYCNTAVHWKSRPTWACELKCLLSDFLMDWVKSRPTWACELKLAEMKRHIFQRVVTPHVGVWVEIYLNFTTDSDGGARLSCAWGVECLIGWYITQGIGSRPSWVWELKCSRLWSVRYNPRHTPSGCDSWNHPTTQPLDNIPVTLHELTMKKMPKLSDHMLS